MKKENKTGELPEINSFLKISDPFVALSLIKKSDNDNNIIIRMTEMEGKDKSVTLTFPFEVKQVIRTNLVEEEMEKLDVKGNRITFNIGHHSIETFKLVL